MEVSERVFDEWNDEHSYLVTEHECIIHKSQIQHDDLDGITCGWVGDLLRRVPLRLEQRSQQRTCGFDLIAVNQQPFGAVLVEFDEDVAAIGLCVRSGVVFRARNEIHGGNSRFDSSGGV